MIKTAQCMKLRAAQLPLPDECVSLRQILPSWINENHVAFLPHLMSLDLMQNNQLLSLLGGVELRTGWETLC